MAQSNQNVSISLTLPISCQICLGKVRHPVICGNFHVFCSACMEVWLKKASQCPTCRTPITPENPCREIIGATNEGECNDNYSVKKKLRKTRSELLLREYEDEIDGLQNENEELRSKNLSLEEQLKTVLGPSSSVSDKSENVNQQSEDGKIDPHFIEEWTKRLAVATELQKELQVEIEKLKEANKTLRAQNVDLVRENSYLKAEVESRSPQKFGRYTVAALEAKISQYERDVKHLQKALERSDKYIEELEARVSESQTGFDKTAAVKHPGYVLWEMMDEGQAEEAVAGQAHWTVTGQTSTMTMRDSLRDTAGTLVCKKRNIDNADFSAPSDSSLTSSKTNVTGMFYDNSLEENSTPEKGDVSSMEHSVLSTPSSPFRCLSLKSPSVYNEQKPRFKPLSYLRKLSFDDCSSSLCTTAKSLAVPTCASRVYADRKSSKPVLWEACTSEFPHLTCQDEHDKHLKGHEEHMVRTLQSAGDCATDDQRTVSEASMDAAYLDKVSELDSMISEGESNRDPHYPVSSMQSAEFDISLIPQLDSSMSLMSQTSSSLAEAEKAHIVSSSELCIKGTPNLQDVSISDNTQLTQDTLEVSSVQDDTMVTGAQIRRVSQSSKTSDVQLPFHICGSHGVEAKSTLFSSPSDCHFAEAETLFQNTAGSENAAGYKAKAKSNKRQIQGYMNDAASPSKMSKIA